MRARTRSAPVAERGPRPAARRREAHARVPPLLQAIRRMYNSHELASMGVQVQLHATRPPQPPTHAAADPTAVPFLPLQVPAAWALEENELVLSSTLEETIAWEKMGEPLLWVCRRPPSGRCVQNPAACTRHENCSVLRRPEPFGIGLERELFFQQSQSLPLQLAHRLLTPSVVVHRVHRSISFRLSLLLVDLDLVFELVRCVRHLDRLLKR